MSGSFGSKGVIYTLQVFSTNGQPAVTLDFSEPTDLFVCFFFKRTPQRRHKGVAGSPAFARTRSGRAPLARTFNEQFRQVYIADAQVLC